MVRELNSLHRLIRTNLAGSPASRAAMKYYVQGSRIPGIYNMGGDLWFLTDCIRQGDRDSIRAYALGCVQAVYDIAMGFDCGVVSIGLLQGDALGGGLEGALCCNVIFAERSARMGLPEILFNSLPRHGRVQLPCTAHRHVGGGKNDHWRKDLFRTGDVRPRGYRFRRR